MRDARRPAVGPNPPLGVDERARSEELVRQIGAIGGPDGFVPFDRFMELALYDERTGRYGREPGPLGAEGDFYTAPQVHPLFGRALAERVRTVRRALGRRTPFRVVEVGPGDGSLAASLLEALGRAPEGTDGLDYLLVERSRTLAVRALERAEAAGRQAKIPVRLAASVAADGPFVGVVVANELLDAMPARRLRRDGPGWVELGVRARGSRLEEAEAPLQGPVPPPPLPSGLTEPTVLEISPAAQAFVREVADHLSEGLFVAIDYGMEESELLAGHPRGTLAAVRSHRPVDPLESPGTADLSVFVNYTRVRATARAAGLVELAYCSQAEALGDWGLPALVDAAVRQAGSPAEEVKLRLAVKSLLFGFERFRVLELAARASAPALGRLT